MATRFNFVDGNSWVGRMSPDGEINAVEVDGTTYVGRNHSSGAMNVYVDTDDSGSFGVNHSSGALRVVIEDTVNAYTSSGAIAGTGTVSWAFDTITFDNASASNYLQSTGAPTGLAATKSFTASFWLLPATEGTTNHILALAKDSTSTGSVLALQKNGSNAFAVIGENSANTNILVATSGAGTAQIADGLQHCCMSFDLTDVNKRHMYVQDISSLSVTTYTNDNLDLGSVTSAFIGARGDGLSRLVGDLGEFVFWSNVYVDLSVEVNRRKLIDANGDAVDLGADGSTPGWGAPTFYFRGSLPGFKTNVGTGGSFTEIGTLT